MSSQGLTRAEQEVLPKPDAQIPLTMHGRQKPCATRVLKTINFLRQEARRILPSGTAIPDFQALIEPRMLQKLHLNEDPSSLVSDPQVKLVLSQLKFSKVTRTLSDPCFAGSLVFVQIQFLLDSLLIEMPIDFLQTAVAYASLAVSPISDFCTQYGPCRALVDYGVVPFQVALQSASYDDLQLQGWVSQIMQQYQLPRNTAVVILNPTTSVINTDADPSLGVLGYHGWATVPYCFVNIATNGPFTVKDEQQVYASPLSHEIAEMLVDPRADLSNPEVCDACSGNCGGLYLVYFDSNGIYITMLDAQETPSFDYGFYINSIVNPLAVYDCPPSDSRSCNYPPPLTVVSKFTSSSGDTCDGTPALAAYNGMLFVAWKGTGNPNLNLELSTDGGKSFHGKFITSSYTLSDAPPAILAHNGILFMAWRGHDSAFLNVGQVNVVNENGQPTITAIINNISLPQSSDTTPALASHVGVLFMAWKAPGNPPFINISFSLNNGQTFSAPYVSGELTDSSPALVSHNGSLFIAWRGSGNKILNVSSVTLSLQNGIVDNIVEFSQNKVLLSETSDASPALASVRHLLYIAWKGNGNSYISAMASEDNGRSFSHKGISLEKSDNAVSLATFNDRCFLAWNGSGNGLYNVAYTGVIGNVSDLLLEAHSGNLVQGTFGTPGNFELAALQPGGILVHYWRDNTAPDPEVWYPRTGDVIPPNGIISSRALSPGSLIQSSYGTSGYPGNFEIVVQEDRGLVHYYRDNSNTLSEWVFTAVISPYATGPGSLIQGSFGTPAFPGNFEVVVLEGNILRHYWRDNSDPAHAWHEGEIISTQATGPGALLQSNYGVPGSMDIPGNLEVVVLEGNNLVHYWHDSSATDLPWFSSATITMQATGPASFLQSTYGTPQNFELVVLEGNNLQHYWRNNSGGNKWVPGPIITSNATGPGTMIQSNYGLPNAFGNLEVVVLEGDALIHYWRNDSDPSATWSSPGFFVASPIVG